MRLFLSCALAFFLPFSVGAAPQIGQSVDFKGPSLADKTKTISISDFKGKPVMLYFWASWCPACQRFAPKVKAVYDSYQSKGVEMVGYSMDYDAATATAYLKKNKHTWPQVHQADMAQRKKYARDFVELIPTVFVIDKEGKFASLGLEDAKAIEKALDEVLK